MIVSVERRYIREGLVYRIRDVRVHGMFVRCEAAKGPTSAGGWTFCREGDEFAGMPHWRRVK